uniref:Peptidase S1 domain-containing protein n=1 Tax=Panagrolaimus sp. ES5 TaxID=591445 RepID=A0AC34FRX5_9BILA
MYDTYKVYSEMPYYAILRPISESVQNKSLLPTSTTAYLPKDYLKKYMLSFDIAILEFPEGTDFGIEPVKLAKDYIEKEGDKAYITGFGNKTSGVSKVLRHAKMEMIDNCYGTLKICGGNKTYHGLPGDSGGPMIIQRNNQWYQIGVSSTHHDYDSRTRVSSYSTVISPRHLLTSANCVYQHGQKSINQKIQLAEYSSFKSIHGQFYPDFRSKNVQSNIVKPVNVTAYFDVKYKSTMFHNLAIIEFPEGTNFGVEPVTLAKDYVQKYLENETLIVAGYGKYKMKKNMPLVLQHSNASYKLHGPGLDVYNSNNKTFTQDDGGPTLIERNGKFYQIFVNYFLGTPKGSRTSVSAHCDFIEKVTKNEVKCESVAPIYEKPLESTTPTFLPPFSEQIKKLFFQSITKFHLMLQQLDF